MLQAHHLKCSMVTTRPDAKIKYLIHSVSKAGQCNCTPYLCLLSGQYVCNWLKAHSSSERRTPE